MLPLRTSASGERVVKGSHVLVAAEWIDSRLGQGAAAQMSEAHGDDWRMLLSMGRYNVDIFERVLSEASEKTGVSVQAMTADIARSNASRDLTTIYRAFMRIAQPQRVLSHTPRLWRTYVHFADARALVNEPGHYIGEGYNLAERDMEWACGCWLGFIPCAIELAGGQKVAGRIIGREVRPGAECSVRFECTYD